MLTYQLQRRNFKVADGAVWKFPNDVEVEFWFEPQEPFGARHGYSRTALQNVRASTLFNANNGLGTVRSEKPFNSVEASVHYTDVKFDLRGNKLFVQCRCETQDDLGTLIYRLQGLLPPIMTVFLYDPPVITVVCGKVGKTTFRWELAEIQFALQIASNEEREKDLVKALSLFGSDLGPNAYRIHAALGYFYKACRLLAAGNGPWEFMPETILNLTKSVEILFDAPSVGFAQAGKGSRDRIRKGLKDIGVDPQLIEEVFVPIAILRNEFDVGHGRLALHKMDELQLIYRFLINAEGKFRELFHHIVTGLAAGSLTLPPYAPGAEAAYSKPLRGVIEALRTRDQTTQGIG